MITDTMADWFYMAAAILILAGWAKLAELWENRRKRNDDARYWAREAERELQEAAWAEVDALLWVRSRRLEQGCEPGGREGCEVAA